MWFILILLLGGSCFCETITVFDFDDPSPEGWGKPYSGRVTFPEEGIWRSVKMEMTLKCDDRTKADDYPCGEWDYLTSVVIFVPAGDTVEPYELGSFVTPYGLGLDLGEGRKWTWDITDMQPLLKGEMAIEAGNNQELLKLEFIFEEGMPPRLPLSVINIWPKGQYRYGALAEDSVLSSRKVVLAEGTQYRIVSRISGHGHHGPGNCCEWRNKTHSLMFNGYEVDRWSVWKNCGDNPLYPQGGTWPFDRAGWCPGTKVEEHFFDFVASDTLEIDYDIEMPDNDEERAGDFRMSHVLIGYQPPLMKTDLQVYEVIVPSSDPAAQRYNPSVIPIISIRNNGTIPATSIDIEYGVEGCKRQHYRWMGELSFGELDTVILPPLLFDDCDSIEQIFFVQIINSQGNIYLDGYKDDNQYYVPVNFPDTLPAKLVIDLFTNNLGRAGELELFIFDSNGKWIFNRSGMADSTLYRDMLDLEPGHYRLILDDSAEDGMYVHWWNTGQNPEMVGASGGLYLLNEENDTLKAFHPDFGERIQYWFTVKEEN